MIAVVLMTFTNSRNAVWKDETFLWLDAAQKSQNKARVHNNLGGYYLSENNLKNAVIEFKTAIKLKPDFIEAVSNLGFAYYDMGFINEALVLQGQALMINPNFRNAHYGYALIMEKLGMYNRAKGSWEMVIRLSNHEDKWLESAKKHIKALDEKLKIENENIK